MEDEPVGPFAAITEHTSGVRALRFSNDCRWLCSVGDIHDGSIFLWSVSGPKAALVRSFARNKCSSSVHDLAWMGKDIVTVGVRQVKVWRPDYGSGPRSPAKAKARSDLIDSPAAMGTSFRALPGRNTLLGPLLDSSFTAVVALSECKAVVATDRGEICLLDNSQGSQSFSILKSIGNAISCMIATEPTQLWVGVDSTKGGEIHRLHLNMDSCEPFARPENFGSPRCGKRKSNAPQPVALGVLRNRIVSLDSGRNLQVFGMEEDSITLRQRPQRWVGTTSTAKAPAFGAAPPALGLSHAGPVMGILRSHTVQRDFTTWDGNGLVIWWSLPEGQYIRSREVQLDTHAGAEQPNELRVLKSVEQVPAAIDGKSTHPATSANELYIYGDKYGTIKSVVSHMLPGPTDSRRLLDHEWKAVAPSSVKAHDGEVNDIAVCIADVGTTLVASAGRDRMIQVFLIQSTDPPLRLVQTIDCHGSSVNSLIFSPERRTLLSASTDRTVSINVLAFNQSDAMAFVPAKTITLKGTPIGMAINRPEALLISTMDKQVLRYDLQSYSLADTVRPLDASNGAIALASIEAGSVCFEEGSQSILLGVCPSDRSVRVHCAHSGATLAKRVGHIDGTSDVGLFTAGRRDDFCPTVVSTGADGTIFIWNLAPEKRQPQDELSSPNTPVNAYTPPLRRVLSRVALSEFSRSLEAHGQTALYATPPRLRSPTRLRKKKSDYSLMGRGTMTGFPRGGPRHRSPSPKASTARRLEGERPSLVSKPRKQSADWIENTMSSAESLSKALRCFRRNLAQSNGQIDALKDLELELFLTQECINKRTGHQHAIAPEDQRKKR